MAPSVRLADLKTGTPVTCKILHSEVNDAEIYVSDEGRYYICQDRISGKAAPDKLGYKYSWSFGVPTTDEELMKELSNNNVRDLKIKGVHTMTDLLTQVREQKLDPDERLLRKTGIVDSCGSLTETGKSVLLDLLFAEKRSDVVEAVKAAVRAAKQEAKNE